MVHLSPESRPITGSNGKIQSVPSHRVHNDICPDDALCDLDLRVQRPAKYLNMLLSARRRRVQST